MSNVLISGVVSAVVSAIASKVTLSHDKKRKVFEKREEAYTKLFDLIDELKEAPYLSFQEQFNEKLAKIRVELELFASDELLAVFEPFYAELNKKRIEYMEEFCKNESILLANMEPEDDYVSEYDLLREEEEYIDNNVFADEYINDRLRKMSTIMRRDIGTGAIPVEYRLEKAKARVKATMKWLKNNARLKKTEQKGE